MTEFLILTHGSFGQSLCETAAKIIGELNGVTCLSSGNLSPDEFYKRVLSIVKKTHENENDIIIGVDIKGGNTWNIAYKTVKEIPSVLVISGLNLGMLLSYYTKRENFSQHELVKMMVEDAKRHIDLICT